MARKKQQPTDTEPVKPAEPQAPDAGTETQPQATEATAAEPQPETSQRPYQGIRSWTRRYAQPVAYEKLTDNSLRKIIFRFELPKGQATPPEEALEVMRSHKQGADGRGTGLRFEHTRAHGKVWTIPNDPEGRALADQIDMELNRVAKKLEAARQER